MEIQQYCSVCKAEYDMTVVPTSDGDDDGVVWLQCPSCKGFLPKVSSSADFAAGASAADTSSPSGEPVETDEETSAASSTPPVGPAVDPEPGPDPEVPDPLDGMDIESARSYRPWDSYAEGDVIHHLAWDDYGVVMAKEALPGNRRVVKVIFATAGIVRLIEQEGDGP